MSVYQTLREMFLVRSKNYKRKADKEYAMYIQSLIKGYNIAAKDHFLNSQKLYEIANLNAMKAETYVFMSWKDLKERNKNCSI
jgi:hypothetical protein